MVTNPGKDTVSVCLSLLNVGDICIRPEISLLRIHYCVHLTLLSRMCIALQLEHHSYVGLVEPIPGLVPTQRLQDGPQGVGGSLKNVTAWPSAQTVASTFDRDLMYKFAAGMAREERDKGANIHLAPMMNIARIPWAGRNFESLGEETYLTTAMTRQLIRGIQSEGILACAKHFALNNQEYSRYDQSSNIDEKTLREVSAHHI